MLNTANEEGSGAIVPQGDSRTRIEYWRGCLFEEYVLSKSYAGLIWKRR